MPDGRVVAGGPPRGSAGAADVAEDVVEDVLFVVEDRAEHAVGSSCYLGDVPQPYLGDAVPPEQVHGVGAHGRARRPVAVVAIGEVVLVVLEDVTAALDEFGVRASPVLVGDVARKVGAEPDRVDPRKRLDRCRRARHFMSLSVLVVRAVRLVCMASVTRAARCAGLSWLRGWIG